MSLSSCFFVCVKKNNQICSSRIVMSGVKLKMSSIHIHVITYGCFKRKQLILMGAMLSCQYHP